MTTIFDRPLSGYRFVQTHRGDTLQAIAARELGDAAQWYTLISINGLVPPYITDDASQVKAGVLLSGDSLMVPAPVALTSTTSDANEVFGTDVELRNGLLATARGDFSLVSGRANLHQALSNRLDTERGDLLWHQDYGSRHRELIGTVNGPTAGLLAAQYAKAALQADPRVQSIKNSSAAVAGDVVSVSVEVQPISGQSMSVSSNG
jgi:phage baseplate assembly protein W